MFGQRIEVFRLFGFPVRVDLSWVLILALAGVIALKDLMKFLSLKMELEGGEDEREIQRIRSTVGAGSRDD